MRPVYPETSFDRFRWAAFEKGYAFDDHSGVWSNRHKGAFALVYNMGDIFVPQNAEIVFNLVMFARNFAISDEAGYYEIRDAYGILDHYIDLPAWHDKEAFIICDTIPAIHRGYVSVYQWLNFQGYTIPEWPPYGMKRMPLCFAIDMARLSV